MPRREILRRPRSLRLMVGGGLTAGVCALVVLVVLGVPWWHSEWAALVVNVASLLSALGGLGVGAWRALATAPRGLRRVGHAGR
jgi:hypothetical protein